MDLSPPPHEDPLRRDAVLVGRVLAGEREAFAALVGHYHRMVAAQARAVLQDPELVDDCGQESFLAAFRHLGELQDPRRFGPWLKTITLRCCIATAEKEARRYHRELAGCDVDLVDPWADEPGPEAEAVQGWVDGVRAAVAGLSRPHQDVLYHFYVAGDDLATIANFLDCPLGTVKRRLHDARLALQGRIAPDTMPEGRIAANRILAALASVLAANHQGPRP